MTHGVKRVSPVATNQMLTSALEALRQDHGKTLAVVMPQAKPSCEPGSKETPGVGTPEI
jgi:hypothetical protein